MTPKVAINNQHEEILRMPEKQKTRRITTDIHSGKKIMNLLSANIANIYCNNKEMDQKQCRDQ